MNMLRRLHENGEEVTITTLADAFKFDDEVTYLFLTGPMKNSEDLQHYFKGRGRRKMNAFLTAALGPEPISHTGARRRSVRVKDAWQAAIQLSQCNTKPVRDPQADSETQFRTLPQIWTDRKTYSPFTDIQQNSTPQ